MLLRKKVQFLIQKGETKKDIAKNAGKDINAITRFVEGKPIEFGAALNITKKYFPKDELSIINDYCKHVRLKNERSALEYYILCGEKGFANQLIEKLKRSDNRHDIEWANFYEIELKRMKDKISSSEVIQQIENSYPETLEMKVYSSILKAYCYFEQKRFDVAEMILSETEARASLIKNEFVRSSYLIRIGQGVSSLSLKKNDIVNCRRYSKYITSSLSSSSLLAAIYNTLGNSYIFEDPQKAIMYLEKSRSMYLESGRERSRRVVENSINFVQSLHGLEPTYLILTDEISDIHANAHYHLREKNNKIANELLDKVIIEPDNHFSKGFHYYYRGEITGDDEYYFKSIAEFKRIGDYFYVNLSIDALRKKKYPDSQLLALSL